MYARPAPDGIILHEGPFAQEAADSPHTSLWTAQIDQPKALARSESYLRQMITTYLDIFGHGRRIDRSGWGEFAVCPDCGDLASIEDVFGTRTYHFLGELLSAQPHPGLPSCIKCDCAMNYFYDTYQLIQDMRTQLTKPEFFGALICDADWQPHGMIYAWRDTVRNVWQEKISKLYEHSQLSWEEMHEQITARSDGALTPETPVLYLAELGMTLPSRQPSLLFALLRSFLHTIPARLNSTPTLVTSEPTKRSYMYLEAAGHHPIVTTDDTPLTMLTGTIGGLRTAWDMTSDDFHKRHRADTIRWKERVGYRMQHDMLQADAH